MIKVKKVYAVDENELEEELNKLSGRIMALTLIAGSHYWWRVITEE